MPIQVDKSALQRRDCRRSGGFVVVGYLTKRLATGTVDAIQSLDETIALACHSTCDSI